MSSLSSVSQFERGSYETSVLSKSPDLRHWPAWMGTQASEEKPKEQKERKFRGGVPPQAPSYDGSRDPQIIKKWRKEVKVWIKLSSPYIPPEEQGLRLWQALKGDGQRKIHERDDDDLYFAENGVEVLIATIEHMFGQDEMVDLDDRLDSFFDPAKMTRRPGESVKDYIDRFELTYSKVALGKRLWHLQAHHSLVNQDGWSVHQAEAGPGQPAQQRAKP